MSGGVLFEFDRDQLAALFASLTPEQCAQALDNAATDLVHIAERAIKEATPQVTGNARRATVSDLDEHAKQVVGRYPYARWLDTGTDSRGRVMRTRPGGYQLKRAGMDAAKAQAPAVLDKCGREIAARWGS